MTNFSHLIYFMILNIIITVMDADGEGESPALNGVNSSRKGQFPFMVYIDTGLDSPKFCGGALLSYYWVLTAAHCINRAHPDNVTVVAGIVQHEDIASETQEGLVIRDVAKMFLHPEFRLVNKSHYEYDIALMETKKPFPVSYTVRKASVGKANEWPEKYRYECFLVGWGKKKSPSSAAVLNYQFVTPKRPNECGLGNGTDYSRNLCSITKEGHGPCQDDLGAVVLCDSALTAVLVGAAQENPPPCGSQGVLHLYEFIGTYQYWVANHVPDMERKDYSHNSSKCSVLKVRLSLLVLLFLCANTTCQ